MHPIHTTLGFIIHSKPYGEAGKMLSIFTREHGLILAIAQGIRLEKSKLRPFIQDYSFGIFSLVRGKELWRLTSAQEIGNASTDFACEQLHARVALLLRRLLQGEEPHPELFDAIMAGRNFLDQERDLSNEDMQTLESLLVFRMTHALGYVGTDVAFDQEVISGTLSVVLLEGLADKRKILNQHINKALKESHL